MNARLFVFVYWSYFMFVVLVLTSYRDLQDIEPAVVDGNGTETGHIIVTTIGGRNGQPKQVENLVRIS